ncbi:MAG: CatB-related O-acetyltransferase [Pseudomonadaceae bacterium]|nr:CatB-related O-acetyltransferase [Pseudomonadaceae bacterium]
MNLFYIYSRVLKKLRGVAIKNSNVHKTSKVESGSTVINSSFDKHSFCGYDCLFNNCEVGSFTSIASNVKVGGSTHPVEFVSTSPVFLSHKDSVKTKLAKHDYHNIPKTVIGSDVWIGEGAFVKSGVTVGHGSVVGMGTVVTKDVPAYSFFCGNPGKVVKMRFEPEIITRMLACKWWELSDSQLQKLGHLISNPIKFLDEVEKLCE